MTKDEIQTALRLVAMGRVNHPQVEELAERLAEVFAPTPKPIPVADFVAAVDETLADRAPTADAFAATDPLGVVEVTPLPKRRKKAE